MRLGAHPEAIMRQLSISKTTYYRHREVIRMEAAKMVMDLAQKDYAVVFQTTLESFQDQILELSKIRDKAQNPAHKIEATRLIGEFIAAIQGLVSKGGPDVLNVVENELRATEVKQLKAESGV